MVTPGSYCVKWGKHPTNISSASCNLFNSQMLVDVTLAADGVQIQAHKLVLAASSVYFQALFTQNPCQHPIVILKDVSIDELRIIIDFVYKGEVEVPDDKLSAVLKTARLLRINGFGDAVMNQGLPSQIRRQSSHGTCPKPLGATAAWHSSSSSSSSSAHGSVFSSLPSEGDGYDLTATSTASPDPPGTKRKASAPAVSVSVASTSSQGSADGSPATTLLLVNAAAAQVSSFMRNAAIIPNPPGLALQSQESIPFRKRLRREFRRERSLSGGDSAQLFPDRAASVIVPSRSSSHVESSLLSPDCVRPPMQTQTSDPGPLRPSNDGDGPNSPVSYTSKHRKMLQRQPRIQRQAEPEPEDPARKFAPIKPRPSPTIIITPDEESRQHEVVCARKSSPEPKDNHSPEDSDSSAKDLSIDEGVRTARSCPPSPPSKISQRSASTTSHRERRKKMQVVFSSGPQPSSSGGMDSGLSSSPSSAAQPGASSSLSLSLSGSGGGGHHCPESRAGSAVSCDYCWNKMDDKGRVQRRKTKYWCPRCRANLCIVPCFQQYHEAGGDGSELPKPRSPFERSASSSTSYLLAVPKNLSKTPSI